jgi:hypothetical protein
MPSHVRSYLGWIVAVIGVLAAFALTACGGSSGGSDTAGFTLVKTPVEAQITLPAGTPITDITTLSPWSSGGATTPNSQGKTRITIFNNGPQYADVRDAQGHLVLSAYLSDTQKKLDAETTAEAMVFFAIGGAAQIGDGPATILAGIRDLTGYGPVVDEISSQLVSQGFVSLQTGNLKDKIQAVIDAVGPPPAKGRGTIAEPTNASGLFLNTIVDGEFTIQNNYLRRTRGWLRQVSYVNTQGQEVEAVGEYKKFDIAAPSRYGGFTGTVYGILTGNLTWTPTVSEPYKIPLAPAGAQSTTYELKTFGLGAHQGNLETLTSDEESELISVTFKSLILDAILPVIANIALPLKGEGLEEFVKFASGSAIMSDLINVARETLPQVYAQLTEGNLKDAISTMWDTGFTSNSALPALLQIMINFGEKYGSDAFFDNSGNISEAIGERLALLGYVDVFFSSADMALFTHDFALSDRSNIFTITTTSGKATLTTDDAIVSVFDTTLVHATIQNKNSDAVYKYEWSVSEGYKLTTSNGNTSDAPNGILASNDDFARISTLTDEPGTALIKCKVSRIDGEPDQVIDQPTREFKFVAAPTISPNPANVDLNKDITITMNYEGEETPSYKFSVNSALFGSLDHTNISENNKVVFSAGGEPGTAILTVDCYLTVNGAQVKFHTKTLDIKVGSEYDPNPVPSYAQWSFQSGNPTNPWEAETFAYLVVPRVPGATRYEISLDDQVKWSWNDGQAIPPSTPWPSVISNFNRYAAANNIDLKTHCPLAYNSRSGATQAEALSLLEQATQDLQNFMAPHTFKFEAFFD